MGVAPQGGLKSKKVQESDRSHQRELSKNTKIIPICRLLNELLETEGKRCPTEENEICSHRLDGASVCY